MHPISKEEINSIARSIGDGPIGLAYHQPEEQAEAHRCFENAARKAAQHGGQAMFGWTFHSRKRDDIPGPGYIFVSHHAVRACA